PHLGMVTLATQTSSIRNALSLQRKASNATVVLGWLALIWTASVVALAVVAMLFRPLMNLAGLTV
ncbi:hypothetical protein QO004_006143, partial [Rhizobium mesoamericanum]|uniref:DUF2474 family protein n=1 Tax=Rhizobium mesoamericanum TaxID=1079800 RepID=UPI00277FA5C9